MTLTEIWLMVGAISLAFIAVEIAIISETLRGIHEVLVDMLKLGYSIASERMKC
jgi:hypothetical protein